MAQPKLLLTGATGVIGGTVLNQLVNSADANVRRLSLTAVVRRQDQASLLAEKGIRAILVNGLDDADGLTQAASDHDIVLNVANGWHASGATALIEGLGKRTKEHGRDTHFIHLSGTTSLSYSSTVQNQAEDKVFSDHDNIYEHEVQCESHKPYAQRTTDLAVVHAGEALGVNTYIVMPPIVYGRGTGLFNNQSQSVPSLVRHALNTGYAEYIAGGEGVLGHVHVTDLANLYDLIVSKIVGGEKPVSGRKGYYFAEPGRHSWADMSALIGNAGLELGVLRSNVPRSINLHDAASKFCNGDEMITQSCFASNACTRPDRSFSIGWKPLKNDANWEESVGITFKDILDDPSIKGGHLFTVKLD